MRSVAVLLGAVSLAIASPLDLVERAQPCTDYEIVTASNGLQFQVRCGQEAVARDIGTVSYFDNAQECYDKCAATVGCVGISWTSGSGTSAAGKAVGGPCYIKSKMVNIRPKLNARTAIPVAAFKAFWDYVGDGNDNHIDQVVPLGECQNFPQDFNDRLSSAGIPAKYTCDFYRDYDCASVDVFWTMGAGKNDVPRDYNDQASSYTCAFLSSS